MQSNLNGQKSTGDYPALTQVGSGNLSHENVAKAKVSPHSTRKLTIKIACTVILKCSGQCWPSPRPRLCTAHAVSQAIQQTSPSTSQLRFQATVRYELQCFYSACRVFCLTGTWFMGNKDLRYFSNIISQHVRIRLVLEYLIFKIAA